MGMDRFIIIFFLLLFSVVAQAADVTEPLQQSSAINTYQSTHDASDHLLAYALSNEGVSYRRGGNNPNSGFDCSGFVRYVFRNVEGVTLPHGSSMLSRVGQHIE